MAWSHGSHTLDARRGWRTLAGCGKSEATQDYFSLLLAVPIDPFPHIVQGLDSKKFGRSCSFIVTAVCVLMENFRFSLEPSRYRPALISGAQFFFCVKNDFPKPP